MKRSLVIKCMLAVLIMLLVTACGSKNSDTSTTGSPSNAVEQNNAKGDTNANSSSDGKELASSVVIGTHSAGSGYHTVGSGLAKIISDYTPIRGNVRPTAGPQAWMSDLNSGNLEFGLINHIDIAFAYNGGPGYTQPMENLRVVFGGMPMYSTGWAVREDSDIYSIRDLKGKPVASDFGGNYLTVQILGAELESVGLSWDDVNGVPVPEFQSSLDALQEKTVVAAYPGSPDSAKVMEVASSVGGVRVLPFGDLKPEDIDENGKGPAQMQAILDKYLPNAFFGIAPAGMGVLKEDTVHIRYDMNLVASKDVSEDTVYEVLKAIWENHTDLHGLISYTNTLSTDDFIYPTPGAPYHDGAIKFYKEMGVWGPEHEELVEFNMQQ